MSTNRATRFAASNVTKFVAKLAPVVALGAFAIVTFSHGSHDASRTPSSSSRPEATVTVTTDAGTGTDSGHTTVESNDTDTDTDTGTDAGTGTGNVVTTVRRRPSRSTTTTTGQTTTTVDQQSEAPIPCILNQSTPCGFSISGSPSGTFAPGATAQPVDLQITNHNAFPITILEVNITVAHATSHPECDGTANLVVARPFTGTARIPGNTSVRLSQLAPSVSVLQWPTLRMPNLVVNQDACKGASFLINYTGTATS